MRGSKLNRTLLALAGGLIILAGCAGQATPASAPTAVPTSAPTSAPTVAPTSAPTVAPTVAPTAAPTVAPTSAPTAAPTATLLPVRDPLTGAAALVRGAVTERPYIVMIDNHPNAYPQSGLDHAAIVFEALAEFGLTRFMAIYAPGITTEAEEIGPVRSTRLYFVQWALPFNGLYVHAGGSPEGLALAESSSEIVNLDALFRANTNYFRRDSRRAAPHNLYSSGELLTAAAQTSGAPRSDIGYLFKPDAPPEQRPQAQTIGYFFLYREDNVGWEYDPATNSYGRLRRGRPAVDAVSGEQLRAKSIVAMEVHEAPIPGDEKGRIEQLVIGSGRARLFLDGVEREITWRKDAPEAPLEFFDASGEEVRFNVGQLWIVALPSLENLTVS